MSLVIIMERQRRIQVGMRENEVHPVNPKLHVICRKLVYNVNNPSIAFNKSIDDGLNLSYLITVLFTLVK